MPETVKDYCLHQLGFIQWHPRNAKVNKRFWVAIASAEFSNGALTPEKIQLLERMLQALNWPLAEVQIQSVGAITHAPNAEKALLFGLTYQGELKTERFSMPYVCLPTLSQLLQDVQLKKQAWKLMQPFVLHV